MDILHDFMLKFESVFTLPAFGKFVRLLQGFMQTHAPKALTELNSHLPQGSHFCGVYDFLNRYAWNHLDLAQRLLDWYVETLLQRQRFLLVVDELLPLGTQRYSSVTQGKWKAFVGIQSITIAFRPRPQQKLARKSPQQEW